MIATQIVLEAQAAFEKQLAWRRKRGQKVEVIKPPYAEDLNQVRCVITVDGRQKRLFYRQIQGKWQTA